MTQGKQDMLLGFLISIIWGLIFTLLFILIIFQIGAHS